MKKTNAWWYGVVDENVIKIKQSDSKLIFFTYPERLGMEFIANYFRLDDNLPHILSQINKDANMAEVIQKFSGLRVIDRSILSRLFTSITSLNPFEATFSC